MIPPIGIDLGTTRSKVAYIDETGRPQLLPSRRGDAYTPSVIFFEDGNNPIVGMEALAEGLIQPEHVLTCFKRGLGSDDVVYTDADGKQFTNTNLLTILIAHLKEDIEKRFNAEVNEAVITVPANFKDHQKQATIDAAKAAGLIVLKLLHEPTAAGIAYAIDKQQNQKLLVYDLGGGTFDVSILECKDDGIYILNTAGRERLGGEDFNDRIKQRVVAEYKKQTSYEPSVDSDPMFYQELSEKVEQAKITISQKSKTRLVIGCRGSQLIFELTRADFEAWTSDLRKETLICTTQAVEEAGLKWEDIDRIICVGGSVRIPAIENDLADLTGMVPHSDIEPDRSVVFGAALQCAIEQSTGGKTLMIGGRAIPSPQAFVHEVTAHRVDCCVVDADGQLVNAVILPKATSIPAQKTDRFALQYEGQTEARIEVLQGEEGQLRDDCLSIGEIVLSHLPAQRKQSKRIEVTYIIDTNGMITAVGQDWSAVRKLRSILTTKRASHRAVHR